MKLFTLDNTHFICPICRQETLNKDKCFMSFRRRNFKAVDGRKEMLITSTQSCPKCMNAAITFIEKKANLKEEEK